MMSQIARAIRQVSQRDSLTAVLRMTLSPQEGMSGECLRVLRDSDVFVESPDIGRTEQPAMTNRWDRSIRR